MRNSPRNSNTNNQTYISDNGLHLRAAKPDDFKNIITNIKTNKYGVSYQMNNKLYIYNKQYGTSEYGISEPVSRSELYTAISFIISIFSPETRGVMTTGNW